MSCGQSCNHQFVSTTYTPTTTMVEKKRLSSIEKLLITRIVLAFILIGHEFVLWHDYRTAYFEHPLVQISSGYGYHNLSRTYDFPPNSSLSFANSSRHYAGNFHFQNFSKRYNDDSVRAVHVKDVPKWSEINEINVDRESSDIKFASFAVSAAIIFLVAYFTLSLLAILAVCTEWPQMTYAVSVIWSAMFILDLAMHLVFYAGQPQAHFILGVASLLCLVYSSILIKSANEYTMNVSGYNS